MAVDRRMGFVNGVATEELLAGDAIVVVLAGEGIEWRGGLFETDVFSVGAVVIAAAPVERAS